MVIRNRYLIAASFAVAVLCAGASQAATKPTQMATKFKQCCDQAFGVIYQNNSMRVCRTMSEKGRETFNRCAYENALRFKNLQ